MFKYWDIYYVSRRDTNPSSLIKRPRTNILQVNSSSSEHPTPCTDCTDYTDCTDLERTSSRLKIARSLVIGVFFHGLSPVQLSRWRSIVTLHPRETSAYRGRYAEQRQRLRSRVSGTYVEVRVPGDRSFSQRDRRL